MSVDRETDRTVQSWLDEGVTQLPDHVLDAVLDQIPATPQRRSGWSAWRSYRMNSYARLAAAAAAVLIIGVVGYQLLPRNGGIGGHPTIAPSPTPSLLAHGNFSAHGIAAELDATGSGANVAGTLSLSEPGTDHRATVDVECARTTADGLIEIGGPVKDSSFVADDQAWHGGFPKGQWVAVVFERGAPVKALWWVTLVGEAPVTSCPALFASIDASPDKVTAGSPGLEPIGGTVDFGS